jgi:hypothetical protein
MLEMVPVPTGGAYSPAFTMVVLPEIAVTLAVPAAETALSGSVLLVPTGEKVSPASFVTETV